MARTVRCISRHLVDSRLRNSVLSVPTSRNLVFFGRAGRGCRMYSGVRLDVRGERRRRSGRLFSSLGRAIAIAGLMAGAASCRGGCGSSAMNDDSDAGFDAAAGTGGAPTSAGGAGGVGTGGGGTGGAGTGGAGVAGNGVAGSGPAGSGGAGRGGAGPSGGGAGGRGGGGGTGGGGVSAALPITAVYSHGGHTCALSSLGTVRCWGDNAQGQLGYGNTNTVGVSSTPASAGDVNVGGKVTQLALGANHTCALLENRSRCVAGATRACTANSATATRTISATTRRRRRLETWTSAAP